ncbi:MAG: hypothetical protein KIT14_08370 [bacterium]|nr:hypothetical protein [bacterium]
MADRRTPRLRRAARLDGLPRWEAGRWRVRYRPRADDADRLLLDAGDVRAPTPQGAILRLEVGTAASAARRRGRAP